jgi:magnesium chelatase family protein
MSQRQGSASSATLRGIEAQAVQVEVVVSPGPTELQILGHHHPPALRESRERVRAALRSSGFDLTSLSILVNLAPADLPKDLLTLDLPIALAILAALGHLPQAALDGRLVGGELGLDGSVRAFPGGLPFGKLALSIGSRELVLPAGSAAEAAPLRAVAGEFLLAPVGTLTQALHHLSGCELVSYPATNPPQEAPDRLPDLSEIRGQEAAKRALEVAAAGGHGLLLLGPPGSGKTMLARRLPGLLPPLSPSESVEVTKIASLASYSPILDLATQRPFRSPHSGTSRVGMVGGGGALPRLGEATYAHEGVLFLDDLPEFRRETLAALRQALQEGSVTVFPSRGGRMRLPARLTLVAALSPCACGHLRDPRFACTCSPRLVELYQRRLDEGFLLDCFDLQTEVSPASLEDLRSGPAETTAQVACRVAAARAVQVSRNGVSNAQMTETQVSRFCALDSPGRALLEAASERLGLAPSTVGRVLRVARTVADLAGAEAICAAHLAEAIQCRPFRPSRFV